MEEKKRSRSIIDFVVFLIVFFLLNGLSIYFFNQTPGEMVAQFLNNIF